MSRSELVLLSELSATVRASSGLWTIRVSLLILETRLDWYCHKKYHFIPHGMTKTNTHLSLLPPISHSDKYSVVVNCDIEKLSDYLFYSFFDRKLFAVKICLVSCHDFYFRLFFVI